MTPQVEQVTDRIIRLYRIFSEQDVGRENPTLNLAMNEFAELAAEAEKQKAKAAADREEWPHGKGYP